MERPARAVMLTEVIHEVWLEPDGRIRIRIDGTPVKESLHDAADPVVHALLANVPLRHGDYADIFGRELADRYRPRRVDRHRPRRRGPGRT